MGLFKKFSKNKDDPNGTKLVPGIGRLPYPAYQGNEPFIFVSYSHADSDRVFAEIKRFNEAGYHVWYDEGIAPGNEWDDEIADALEKCTLFVVFLTKNSVNSKNVKNEIDFAIDDNIPAIGIYLEPCELKGGLKLRFRHAQAILRYTITSEDEYVYRFTKAFANHGVNSKKTYQKLERYTDNNYGETVNKPAADNTTQQTVNPQDQSQNKYNDSPEDAKKRANGDLVRVDGYDIEHGSLKGYFGTDKDLKIPNSAAVIWSTAFKNCRLFVESIDLNRAGCVLNNAFENCPNLHTIKVPPTVTTFKPNAIVNCPNVTLYIRRSQLPEGYEERFTGKKIVYLDEPENDATDTVSLENKSLSYLPYKGNDPYIFVSYAHMDYEIASKEIRRMIDAGFNVWYDELKEPGYNYSKEIAEALNNCSLYVVLITPTSAKRTNVLSEINYAMFRNKPIVAIHLKETDLSVEIELRLSAYQSILKYKMSEEKYQNMFIYAFERLGLHRNEA